MTNPGTAPTRCFQFRLPKPLVVVMLFVILLLSFVVPVQRKMVWIDAITASTKTQTYVILSYDMTPLMKTVPRIKLSALADWLAKKEGGLTFDWHYAGGPLTTIWGTTIGRDCWSPPPIYPFRGDSLEDFVKSSSDEDLRHFVDVMRHGTEQEQRAEIHAAIEKLLAK